MARKKEPKVYPPDDYSSRLATLTRCECLREYRFHPKRLWRFDYALPALKLAIEIEGGTWSGGRHITPTGFLKDMEKYNTATSMGWSVLRFTPQNQNTQEAIDTIINTIKARLIEL